MDNTTGYAVDPAKSANTLAKVVPLLEQLSRAEELTSSLVMRLEPITRHDEPSEAKDKLSARTVTERIGNLGDTLQYLLNHIEL